MNEASRYWNGAVTQRWIGLVTEEGTGTFLAKVDYKESYLRIEGMEAPIYTLAQ